MACPAVKTRLVSAFVLVQLTPEALPPRLAVAGIVVDPVPADSVVEAGAEQSALVYVGLAKFALGGVCGGGGGVRGADRQTERERDIRERERGRERERVREREGDRQKQRER